MRRVDAGVPCLHAVDYPVITVSVRDCFHMRGVRPVIGLGDTEGKTPSGILSPATLHLLLGCRTQASATGLCYSPPQSARSADRYAAQALSQLGAPG